MYTYDSQCKFIMLIGSNALMFDYLHVIQGNTTYNVANKLLKMTYGLRCYQGNRTGTG